MYLLFAGFAYYPLGGWEDYKGTFPTLRDAQEAGYKWNEEPHRWWHIVHNNTVVDDSTNYS